MIQRKVLCGILNYSLPIENLSVLFRLCPVMSRVPQMESSAVVIGKNRTVLLK